MHPLDTIGAAGRGITALAGGDAPDTDHLAVHFHGHGLFGNADRAVTLGCAGANTRNNDITKAKKVATRRMTLIPLRLNQIPSDL